MSSDPCNTLVCWDCLKLCWVTECRKEEEIECLIFSVFLFLGAKEKSSLNLSIMNIQLNDLIIIVSLFEFSL